MKLGSKENPCRNNREIDKIMRGMLNCKIYTLNTFEISEENLEQAKANIPLSDISITEYEDSKLHRVDSWERKDDKDPKSEHVTITKYYKYLLSYREYCTFANNEFDLYAKGINLILNPNGYWYPKFSMKNMSFHISTEEYELKRKIDNLEIEKKVYIDDKNK